MEHGLPGVEDFFPFWRELAPEHREALTACSQPRHFDRGELLLPYKDECLGLMLIRQGQFRAFILSETGKEVTLYRLPVRAGHLPVFGGVRHEQYSV